jgi:hypothetical protein
MNNIFLYLLIIKTKTMIAIIYKDTNFNNINLFLKFNAFKYKFSQPCKYYY